MHPEDRDIGQSVLQNNAYWAHAENITISMLCDEREEVRRQAVMWIKQARENFNSADHPRQFFPPDVKFEASDYTKMIDWDKVTCTEPPLTMGMPMEEIMDAFRAPLILPDYPNHTQKVESLVRVVTEVAPKRAGYTARHRLILKLLESRKICQVYNTKKHGIAFLYR